MPRIYFDPTHPLNVPQQTSVEHLRNGNTAMSSHPLVGKSSSDNPYVGPHTYRRDQAHLFFGREREAEELFSRVVSQRLVLFYAQSGAGKSSLLQTQLIPRLEEAGFVVLPVGHVGGDLRSGVDDAVDNIYLFNLMTSLDRSQRTRARFVHLDLPCFLANLTSEDGKIWHFDPREGETGRGGEEETRGQRADDDSATHAQRAPAPTATPNYVLIIDQFEEIITTHGGRWIERAEFFRQLEAAMIADPNLSVVLTLREDFVASLAPFAQWMSDKLCARYAMPSMSIEAAKDAIRKPAELFQCQYQPEAIDLLVNNLSQVLVAGKEGTENSPYIEPVQLQVVCYQLWEKLKNHPAPLISKEAIQQAGDIDCALAIYYEETIATALQGHPINGGERRLRAWFEEHLITEEETRGTVYQGEEETAGLPNGLVLELANRFLLRSEQRAGGRWIELTHDRFVEPIRSANRAWEVKLNNPLLAVTQLWLENNRDPAHLLKDQQLRDAQTFAQTQSHLLSDDEKTYLYACIQAEADEKSRLAEATRHAEAQRRRTRNLWQIVSVAAALALLALIGLGWAFQQRSIAQQNANSAATAQARAQSEAENALQARATAEVASTTAQQNAKSAATAQARAQSEAENALQAKATAEVVGTTAQENANSAATAQAQAQATVEAQRNLTAQLQQQVQASHMAHTAALTNINKTIPQYPQLALLLAVEAVHLTTPPIPSSLTTLHDLLERTGGRGIGSHTDSVFSVAFSPDGKTLASASMDNTIRLWSLDQPTAKPIVLTGHDFAVTSVAFSPDGKTLASASFDNTIRLWSLEQPTVKPIVLTGHTNFVTSVTFSPDGKTLASASMDNTIRLWSLDQPTADPIIILNGHDDAVLSVAISPDGKTLASDSDDNTIRLWSLAQPTAAPIILTGHDAFITSVAFAPDGKTLASGSYDNTIRLWSLEQPSAKPRVLSGHEDSVWSVAISPDGKTLASSSGDGAIRLWSLAQPTTEPIVLRGHDSSVTSVAFSPDGKTLASGSGDKTIRLWSLEQPMIEPFALRGHENFVNSVAFAPDGKTLASVSHDKTVRLWSLQQPDTETIVLTGHDAFISGVAFSPDGKTLASGSGDNTIRLWSLQQPTDEPIVLTGHGFYVSSVAFSPDGKTLASGSYDDTIRLWSLQQPTVKPIVLTGHTNFVSSVAFSPDGRTLASGSGDGTIRLWSLAQLTAEPIVLTGHDSSVLGVAFSPDGKTLASAGEDSTIRLWSLEQPTAKPIVLTGHKFSVHSVAFSPDGKTLASGSYDNTIRLWSLAQPTAAPIVLTGHTDSVNSVAFSPDGKTLASASDDNTIRLWTISPEALLNLACTVVGRDLSIEEWQHYFPERDYEHNCLDQPLPSDYLNEVVRLAKSGEISASLIAISQVVQLDPNTEISGNTWNDICWYGAVAGFAKEVMVACENAVAADLEDGATRDSRGLARALSGDRDGAIEDFEFALQWAKQTNYDESFITSRQHYLDDLKAGKNPFTPEVLQQLRNE